MVNHRKPSTKKFKVRKAEQDAGGGDLSSFTADALELRNLNLADTCMLHAAELFSFPGRRSGKVIIKRGALP
jgi:hypothetical protein